MKKNIFLVVLAMSFACVVLFENFTVMSVSAGILVSAGSIYICYHLLPPLKTKSKINLAGLVLYPFFLIGQVYISAFNVIKLIIMGADVDIIEVKTKISDNFLRLVLANSITLTPGSVSLELNDDTLVLLWLKGKKQSFQDSEKAGGLIVNRLERMLIKADK